MLQHGAVPDWVVVPVGGGGTLASVWRVFHDLHRLGVIDRFPKLAGVQPLAYNALQVAEQRGLATDEELRAISSPATAPTLLVKLQHSYPYDGAEALAAIRASGGAVHAVSDEEAVNAVLRIGAIEGIYVEPSSAVVLPTIERLLSEGRMQREESVVAVLTGSGHRETHALIGSCPLQVERISRDNGLERLAAFLTTETGVPEQVA